MNSPLQHVLTNSDESQSGVRHCVMDSLCLQEGQLGALGKHLLSESEPFVPHTIAYCVATARLHLSDSETLRLGHLPLLLADFKTRLGQSGEEFIFPQLFGPSVHSEGLR